MGYFAKKLAIISLSFLASLAIMEGALRALDFEYLNNTVKNKDNLYTLKPDSEFVVNRKCFKNIVKTNSLGFHSKETTVEKPGNIFRIAILGDSFVKANEVPLEQAFFSILENKLNQLPDKKHQYEVMSFGMDSHGTILNKIFAEKYAHRFSPDLIIDAFVANDVEEDANYSEAAPAKDWRESKIITLKKMIVGNSLTVQYLLKNYSILKDRLATSGLALQNKIDVRRGVHLNSYPAEVAEAWRKESGILKDFSDFAKSSRAKLLIVFIPQDYMLEQKLFAAWMKDSKNVKIDEANLKKPEQELERITKKLGIPFAPALDYFQSQFKISGTNPTWACDGHYNQSGHQWLANVLYEHLTKDSKIINRP